MPSLPVVSGTDAVRALQRLGFVIARQRGSHIVLHTHKAHTKGAGLSIYMTVRTATMLDLIP